MAQGLPRAGTQMLADGSSSSPPFPFQLSCHLPGSHSKLDRIRYIRCVCLLESCLSLPRVPPCQLVRSLRNFSEPWSSLLFESMCPDWGRSGVGRGCDPPSPRPQPLGCLTETAEGGEVGEGAESGTGRSEGGYPYSKP